MNARLKPEDREARVDVALENLIDAEWNRMKLASSDRESQDALTEAMVLIRRRSDTQLLKFEFQRRALEKSVTT